MEHVLGVHLVVPQHVARKLSAAMRGTKAAGYHNYRNDPHVTMYLARYTPQRYVKLLQTIGMKRRLFPEVTLTSKSVGVAKTGRGTFLLSVHIRSNDRLKRLHRRILETANALRGGLIRSKDQEKIQNGTYGQSEVQRIKKYGYQRVLSRFDPHITLGEAASRTDARQAAKIFNQRLKRLPSLSWRAVSMVVGLYRFNPKTRGYYQQHHERTVPLM